MPVFNDTQIAGIVIHDVGNRTIEEDIVLSDAPIKVGEDIMELLQHYFLSSFKIEQYYHFGQDDEAVNEIKECCSAIFDDNSLLFEESVKIAQYLYSVVDHPNIKGGEVYVVYFNDCVVGDEWADGIGIFKSENKETYLKVYGEDNGFNVDSHEGININKLDKGCLIFNTNKADGYKLCVVDKTNPNNEAAYWVNKFLKAIPVDDNFYQTGNYINLCKSFAQDVLNKENNIDRADQIDFLNRSKDYFSGQQEFSSESFEQSVLEDPHVIDAFSNYKSEYQTQNEEAVQDEFSISEDAVKKYRKDLKSVLKLDKNFHVYIHGSRRMIEKGFDDARKLNYYKLYFDNEN